MSNHFTCPACDGKGIIEGEPCNKMQAGPDKEEMRIAKLKAENVRLRQEIKWIKGFAENHHADQSEHYWLHALTVDIPYVCEKAISELEGGDDQ